MNTQQTHATKPADAAIEPITKEQWFDPKRQPPVDFTNAVEAWGFAHYRRFIWLLCKLVPRLAMRLVMKHFYEPRRFPRPRRERELLKQGESFTLDFDDGELACWRFASLNAELPLKTALVVHGWEARAAQLGSLVEPLQRLGYQVYLLDGPAHGDSDGCRSNPTHYATAIERVAKKLKTIDLLVAHSFGAYASMRAMIAGLPVEKFIAIAGVVYYRNPMRDVRIMFNVPNSAKPHFDQAVEAELGISCAEMDILEGAKQLQIPCLYLHDPQDQDTPYFGAADIVAALPNASIVPICHVGHRKILWDQATIDAMSRWLQG